MTTPRPNLVLVVLDDLVDDDMTPERTPQWTDFVAAGRQFSRAYSMPVCSQARACLAFGAYGRNLPGGPILTAMNALNGPTPPNGTPTLWSVLKAAGYHTCHVGKWHLGPNSSSPTHDPAYLGAPLSRGADTWKAGAVDNLESYTDWTREDDYVEKVETTYATQAQIAQAVAWWGSTAYPKLLTMWLAAPHAPFHDPPAALLGGYVPSANATLKRQRYEKMIRSADWALGQVRALPGIANSVVCVVSDNGTPEQVPGPDQDPARLKGTAYDGGSRVAMAWYGPPQFVTHPVEGFDQRLVHIVDVPTTLALIGCATVPAGWDGSDLRPALIGPVNSQRMDPVLIEADDVVSGLVQGAVHPDLVKLIASGLSGGPELYDLTDDPDETINFYGDAAYAAVQAELEAFLAG